MCNRENIRPESGIVVLVSFLFFSVFNPSFFIKENLSKTGRLPANWPGEFEKFYKKKIVRWRVFFFFTVYCTNVLAD